MAVVSASHPLVLGCGAAGMATSAAAMTAASSMRKPRKRDRTAKRMGLLVYRQVAAVFRSCFLIEPGFGLKCGVYLPRSGRRSKCHYLVARIQNRGLTARAPSPGLLPPSPRGEGAGATALAAPNVWKNRGRVMKIYLVGFMGAGKTTVGRELAARTGMPFFDLDELVEAAEGISIKEI